MDGEILHDMDPVTVGKIDWRYTENVESTLMIVMTSLLLAPLEARGRRGGGSYRGGNAMNRAPTMSGASNRPAGSQARQRPQNRPVASQGQAVSQRPSSANRTELRNQVNQYAQNRQLSDRRASVCGMLDRILTIGLIVISSTGTISI